jgi:hypothetical protein
MDSQWYGRIAYEQDVLSHLTCEALGLCQVGIGANQMFKGIHYAMSEM